MAKGGQFLMVNDKRHIVIQKNHRYLAVLKCLSLVFAMVWVVGCSGGSGPSQSGPLAFYVDPVYGNDFNDGKSTSMPFLTVAHARDVVSAVNGAMTQDLYVYLREGTYYQPSTLIFGPSISGTNGYNVIFAAYPGETPIISGGIPITGWRVHDPALNIWQAPAPGLQTRQLYADGARAVRAHSGAGLPGAVQTSTGYTTTDTSMQGWRNIANVEFIYNGLHGGTRGAEWTERRCSIASISPTGITMKTPGWTNCTNDADQTQSVSIPTDIENAYELLTYPGMWYLDLQQQVIYYIPIANENMATASIIAPTVETLMSVAGTVAAPVSNLQFQGISFAYATWLGPNGDGGFSEIQANYCKDIGWIPGNVVVRAAHDLAFGNCSFAHLGSIGLDIAGGSQNINVSSCEFFDISGDCLKLGSTDDPVRANRTSRDTDITVDNCYIHDSPCEYHGGVGVLGGYISNGLITHNEIANTPYSGISLGWGWGTVSYAENNQFTYNNIHDFCEKLADGGGIYTLSEQAGTKWEYNWFHDGQATGYGGAMYPDIGSADMEICDNVCDNIADWLFISSSTCNNINVHDNFSSTDAQKNNGINCPVTNLTVVDNNNWPTAALSIMSAAGIEPSSPLSKSAESHVLGFTSLGGAGSQVR
jgi:hypothetical protein